MPRHTPDQRRAGSQLWYAIQTGRIPPAKELTCVDCGNPAQEYDHYLGYEREHYLDVQPVCGSCHKKRSISRGEHPGPPKQWGHGPRAHSRPRLYIGPLMADGRFSPHRAKSQSLGSAVLKINPPLYDLALSNESITSQEL